MQETGSESAGRSGKTSATRPRQRSLAPLLYSGEHLGSRLSEFAVAVLRITTGFGLAFLHGWQKLPPSLEIVNGLESRGLPLPYLVALLLGWLAFAGGLALVLGLATRLAAVMAGSAMLVTLSVWQLDAAWVAIEPSLIYGLVCFFFLLVGGGQLSLDALLRRRSP